MPRIEAYGRNLCSDLQCQGGLGYTFCPTAKLVPINFRRQNSAFHLARYNELGYTFCPITRKCGFVGAQQCAEPCVVCASVVQSESNGAPPTRAALVPYLSRFTLAGVTGFFTHKAVRHSLLAKLTIPITTVRSAHTAMIVWGSIGFSDLSKPPGRRSTELAHYSMLHSSYPLLGRAHDRRHAQASGCRRAPVNDQGPSDCALELVTPAR